MPKIKIRNRWVNYVQKGTGIDILFLHGWGQNIEMMLPCAEHFERDFKVTVLDFQGHGESEEPETAWGVSDFADALHEFCTQLNIANPILVGHSFGCRVAFHYASKHPVRKMVLTGAAGLKPKRGLDWYAKTYTYKLGKKLVQMTGNKELEEQLKRNSGSSDYRNATGIMRETFVKVVNDDVRSLLPQMEMPVLLIFGEFDEATPLSDGKYMEQNMKDAALIVFEKDDHYAYWHQIHRFNRILDAFFEKERGEQA